MPFQKGVAQNGQKPKRAKPNPIPGGLAQGRPTSYKPEYDEMARRLRLLMLTKEELAKYFGVTTTTLDLWCSKYPNFNNAYAQGGEIADAEIVDAMRHRALGYSHRAEKIMVVNGQVVREEYIEHYPPDTAAGSLLLANRQRGRWKLKPEAEEQGAGNINIKISGGLPDA